MGGVPQWCWWLVRCGRWVTGNSNVRRHERRVRGGGIYALSTAVATPGRKPHHEPSAAACTVGGSQGPAACRPTLPGSALRVWRSPDDGVPQKACRVRHVSGIVGSRLPDVGLQHHRMRDVCVRNSLTPTSSIPPNTRASILAKRRIVGTAVVVSTRTTYVGRPWLYQTMRPELMRRKLTGRMQTLNPDTVGMCARHMGSIARRCSP